MLTRFRSSLTFKLILAFVLVSTIQAAFIAFFVEGRTEAEFGRYQNNRDFNDLTRPLERHYDRQKSWDDIEEGWFYDNLFFDGTEAPAGAILVLLDENQRVVTPGAGYTRDQYVEISNRRNALPIRDERKTVGWLLVEQADENGIGQAEYNEIENQFLTRVRGAIIMSSLAAVILSAVAAIWFARGFTRPLKELTHATQDMAKGNLEQEVAVRSKDEIGRLATSFNKMSTDLAEANQQRRQMTADIAHDLRTPLSIILGYTEAMSDGKLAGTPEIYNTIHGEANMLKRLIDDLRTLALADAGELTLNQIAMPPRELLERTVLSYARQAEQAGVTLDLNISDKLPMVDVDPERIAQVLGNLVSNALRYTPPEGSIALSAELNADGDHIQFEVADTGSGISPDDLTHIFDRFYRADKAREQSGQSGLGLAIARSIVLAHGGEITAESEVGVGTRFIIALPTST